MTMFQAATLQHAPDRERAEKEWKLFRATFLEAKIFGNDFAADNCRRETEIPFLLKIKPRWRWKESSISH